MSDSSVAVTNVISHHRHSGKNNNAPFHSIFLKNNWIFSVEREQLWPAATVQRLPVVQDYGDNGREAFQGREIDKAGYCKNMEKACVSVYGVYN